MTQALFPTQDKGHIERATPNTSSAPSRASLIEAGSKVRVGRPPVGGAMASWVGLLLAAGLIALGIVLLMEAAALHKIANFSSWSKVAFAAPGDVAHIWKPLAFATALGLAGLCLTVIGLKPRKRRAAAAGKDKLVWVDRSALQEIVYSHVANVPGVDSHEVKVRNARKVAIHVQQLPGAGSEVAAAVRKSAQEAVAGLSPTPTIKVHTSRPSAT